MTTASLLICALVLDALLGEPRWLWRRAPHPAVLMGRVISFLESRLNNRTKMSGSISLVGIVVLAGVLGWGLSLFGPVVQVIVAAILIAQHSLVRHVQQVSDDLRLSLISARKSLSMIVSRDTQNLHEDQVARSAIESAAENMSDGVIAPAFWFLVGGLPGICIYKMVNTADSMIGYRTDRYENFGWAAAKLDDVLNWVPARLTGFGFWLVGGCAGAWAEIKRDAYQHKSPNAGWPEAALSRSLNVALAGPRPYDGVLRDLPWVHTKGLRNINAAHVDAAVAQLWRLWTMFAMLCLTLALLL